MEKAKTAMESARKRVEQAEERLKAAKDEVDQLEVRLREERDRVPPVLLPNDRLLQSTRVLLEALQQASFPQGIPREVHVAMEQAKAVASAKEGPPAATSPSEEDTRGCSRSAEDASLGSGDRDKVPWADEENVDDLMESLDDQDEDNVDALADIARRLKKARRV